VPASGGAPPGGGWAAPPPPPTRPPIPPPPADLIAAERRHVDRVGEIYHLAYNPGHRWYWFPQMRRDEALVFKCYDSLVDGRARFTAHGSFDDPGTPAGAPPRESIEVRALALWGSA
jgi:hypothetical protein